MRRPLRESEARDGAASSVDVMQAQDSLSTVMTPLVTVAIPTRDGARVLEETLAAVTRQQLPDGTSTELLVCDSGSRDATVALARSFGARVIEIPPARFSHGATRNLLMERSDGDHVAFLTQDAVPAGERWLARLLAGFSLAGDVALVFGPYRPRSDASPIVARELTAWFDGFSPSGEPRIDRLSPAEQQLPPRALLGARAFFTDANGCVARAAWNDVPFRPVTYAEDHVLALDMLRAGYAKVYQPGAAVIHSHEYSLCEWLRRSFDEARALREVYGWVEPAGVRTTWLKLRGLVGADRRFSADNRPRFLAASTLHHGARICGALLGGRSDRLPPGFVQRLSLEGRER
jgi:rhamnosyltransferase